MLVRVKWLRAVMAVVLIGAFALATNHCRLEVLVGFLVCCSHDDGASGHQDDDCDTDACASLESGLYKSEQGGFVSIKPLVITIVEIPAPPSENPGASDFHNFATFAHPELPVTWQFALRAASPPRAPSIAS